MLDFWSRFIHQDMRWKINRCHSRFHPLMETYEVLSSASVEDLWRKVVDLADVSWHPLLTKTNVPYGLIPKPGLIYQAVGRLFPISMHIFVERVQPGELLSVRILAIPGVEERVTYRVESTLCGTQVSYSVTLKGWLSPLVWSVIRPYAARVAQDLAHAAEQERLMDKGHRGRFIRPASPDLLSWVVMVGVGGGLLSLASNSGV
jgi:Polyketide cyclase / dehydrase and lipid transport